jgi:hypothetical protein
LLEELYAGLPPSHVLVAGARQTEQVN